MSIAVLTNRSITTLLLFVAHSGCSEENYDYFLQFNVQAVAASSLNLAYVRALLTDFIFKSNDVHVLYIWCMTFMLAAV